VVVGGVIGGTGGRFIDPIPVMMANGSRKIRKVEQ
jgi:hypothetical protein